MLENRLYLSLKTPNLAMKDFENQIRSEIKNLALENGILADTYFINTKTSAEMCLGRKHVTSTPISC